jgi:hypothetical protein
MNTKNTAEFFEKLKKKGKRNTHTKKEPAWGTNRRNGDEENR